MKENERILALIRRVLAGVAGIAILLFSALPVFAQGAPWAQPPVNDVVIEDSGFVEIQEVENFSTQEEEIYQEVVSEISTETPQEGAALLQQLDTVTESVPVTVTEPVVETVPKPVVKPLPKVEPIKQADPVKALETQVLNDAVNVVGEKVEKAVDTGKTTLENAVQTVTNKAQEAVNVVVNTLGEKLEVINETSVEKVKQIEELIKVAEEKPREVIAPDEGLSIDQKVVQASLSAAIFEDVPLTPAAVTEVKKLKKELDDLEIKDVFRKIETGEVQEYEIYIPGEGKTVAKTQEEAIKLRDEIRERGVQTDENRNGVSNDLEKALGKDTNKPNINLAKEIAFGTKHKVGMEPALPRDMSKDLVVGNKSQVILNLPSKKSGSLSRLVASLGNVAPKSSKSYYNVFLVNPLAPDKQIVIAKDVELDDEGKAAILPEKALPDGTYNIMLKSTTTDEIIVGDKIIIDGGDSDLDAPEIKLSSGLKKIGEKEDRKSQGKINRPIFGDLLKADLFGANPSKKLKGSLPFVYAYLLDLYQSLWNRFLVNHQTSVPKEEAIETLTGEALEGEIVVITWKSVILNSVVIADSKNKFVAELPRDLPSGDHEVIVYKYKPKQSKVSSANKIYFHK